MRVLFTTLPGAGDFYPLIPLARALVDAGHVVAFAAAPRFCPEIAAAGFAATPAGPDWLLTDRGEVYGRARERAAVRGQPFSVVRDVVADLLALARAWAPDLLVREPLEFGAAVAAEALGLPHAVCGPLFAFWQGSWHDAPGEVARPELDALRAAHGLPPDPALTMLHRYLHLAPLPPSFAHPDLAVPPTVHFLRPASADVVPGEVLPDWVERLPPRPTVHASLGTLFHRTPGVFEAILAGLRDEDLNLILAVGRDWDPAEFGPQPPNVRIARYLPHSLLLPRCDLIVTHGGFGSLMVALAHGLPLVLIPLLGGDQAGNARRCAALGVGRVIGADEHTPESPRAAVRTVLADHGYRAAAARMRGEIAALPGLEHGVALLERLAREQEPILSA
jgi:MGT family glycosyltransferase